MYKLRQLSVLIIDDDIDLCKLLRSIISQESFHVDVALSGKQGIEDVLRIRPDLVLLDLMMPDMSGWKVALEIRKHMDVPIIVLSALSQTAAIVRALEAGADDYISKPFNKEELIARIQALLRRTALVTEETKSHRDYEDERLSIDLEKASVLVNGNSIFLTPTEYRLFAFLFMNSDRVCSTEQILEHVWRDNIPDKLNYLHVYFWKLRKKIEVDPSSPVYLQTEHGIGYRFFRQV